MVLTSAGWPFAVIFGVFFLIAAWLLRSGRIMAGAVFAGILCLFEILGYPSWYRHGALDWTYRDCFRPGVAGRADRASSWCWPLVSAAGPRPDAPRHQVSDLAGEPHVVHHELMDEPAAGACPRPPHRGRGQRRCGARRVGLRRGGRLRPAGTAVFADTLSFAFVLAVIAVVGAVVVLAVPGNRGLAAAGRRRRNGGGRGIHPGRDPRRPSPRPVRFPAAGYLAAIGPALQAAGLLIAVVGVPVVFPDGHLPGPRWRWLAWCAIAAMIFLFLGSVLAPHTQESRLAGWHSPLGLPVRDGNVAGYARAIGILLTGRPPPARSPGW